MIEPMFPLKVAVELIPMTSMAALYQLLSKNKDAFGPPLYKSHSGRLPMRMLTESEILLARELAYRRDAVYAGNGRPSKHKLINAIIARATGA